MVEICTRPIGTSNSLLKIVLREICTKKPVAEAVQQNKKTNRSLVVHSSLLESFYATMCLILLDRLQYLIVKMR